MTSFLPRANYFHCAADNSPGVAGALLEAGARPAALCPQGQTALMYAIDNDLPHLAFKLIERVSFTPANSKFANACKCQQPDRQRITVACHYKPVLSLAIDWSPLASAWLQLLYTWSENPVKFIITHLRKKESLIRCAVQDKHESHLGKKDSKGLTALHHCAKVGNSQLARSLLQTGLVEVDDQDKFGATPLYHALKSQNNEVAQALLEHKVWLPQKLCFNLFPEIKSKERADLEIEMIKLDGVFSHLHDQVSFQHCRYGNHIALRQWHSWSFNCK